MLQRLRPYFWLYALLAPALIYFVVFVFVPLGLGLFYSLHLAGIGGIRGFVGLANYLKLLDYPNFWVATGNTIAIAAGITAFGTFVPTIPALALAEITPDWLKRALQTTIYTPYLLSWVIIIGIWSNTLSPIGLVNSVLLDLHLIAQPIMFFSSPDWAQPMVIAQTVWKDMGFHALIYYSALLSIDDDVLEAASLDGAGAWAKIRYVVLPHLGPMMAVVFVITLQGSLHTFDSAFLMLNGRTTDKLLTLAVLAYQKGVTQFDLGLASACGALLLVLCLAAAALARLIAPRTVRL